MIELVKNNKTGVMHLRLGVTNIHCGAKCQERVRKEYVGFVYDDFPNKLYSIVEMDITYKEFKENKNICSRCKKSLDVFGDSNSRRLVLSKFKDDESE